MKETEKLIRANQKLNAKCDILEDMRSITQKTSDIYHLVGKLSLAKEKALEKIEKIDNTESNEYYYYREYISYINIIILTIHEGERE